MERVRSPIEKGPNDLNNDRFKTLMGNSTLHELKGQRGAMVIGNMGAGKSSLIAIQMGADFEMNDDGVYGCPNPAKGMPKISSEFVSETLSVEMFKDEQGIVYLDTPGLNENRGHSERMWTTFSTSMSMSLLEEVSCVVVCMDYTATIGGERGAGMADLSESIQSVVGSSENSSQFYKHMVFVFINGWAGTRQVTIPKIIEKAKDILETNEKKKEDIMSLLEKKYPLDPSLCKEGQRAVDFRKVPEDDRDKIDFQKCLAGIELAKAITEAADRIYLSFPDGAEACAGQRKALIDLIHKTQPLTKAMLNQIVASRKSCSFDIFNVFAEIAGEYGEFLRCFNDVTEEMLIAIADEEQNIKDIASDWEKFKAEVEKKTGTGIEGMKVKVTALQKEMRRLQDSTDLCVFKREELRQKRSAWWLKFLNIGKSMAWAEANFQYKKEIGHPPLIKHTLHGDDSTYKMEEKVCKETGLSLSFKSEYGHDLQVDINLYTHEKDLSSTKNRLQQLSNRQRDFGKKLEVLQDKMQALNTVASEEQLTRIVLAPLHNNKATLETLHKELHEVDGAPSELCGVGKEDLPTRLQVMTGMTNLLFSMDESVRDSLGQGAGSTVKEFLDEHKRNLDVQARACSNKGFQTIMGIQGEDRPPAPPGLGSTPATAPATPAPAETKAAPTAPATATAPATPAPATSPSAPAPAEAKAAPAPAAYPPPATTPETPAEAKAALEPAGYPSPAPTSETPAAAKAAIDSARSPAEEEARLLKVVQSSNTKEAQEAKAADEQLDSKAHAEAAKPADDTPTLERLQQMKNSERRKLAVNLGIPEQDIEEAGDADDPKQAMIELICAAQEAANKAAKQAQEAKAHEEAKAKAAQEAKATAAGYPQPALASETSAADKAAKEAQEAKALKQSQELRKSETQPSLQRISSAPPLVESSSRSRVGSAPTTDEEKDAADIQGFKTFIGNSNIHELKNKIGVLVLGRVGVGKSTTIAIQQGAITELDDEGKCNIVTSNLDRTQTPMISDGFSAQTFTINVFTDKNTGSTYLDTAGLNNRMENKGNNEHLWNLLSTSMSLSLLNEVSSVVMVLDYQSTFSERGAGMSDLASAFSNLPGSSEASQYFYQSMVFLITNGYAGIRKVKPESVLKIAKETLDANLDMFKEVLSRMEARFPGESAMPVWVGSSYAKERKIDWDKLPDQDKADCVRFDAIVRLCQAMIDAGPQRIYMSFPDGKEACEEQRSTLVRMVNETPNITKAQLQDILKARKAYLYSSAGPSKHDWCRTTDKYVDDLCNCLNSMDEGCFASLSSGPRQTLDEFLRNQQT